MVTAIAVGRRASSLARSAMILVSLLAGAQARAGCTDMMPDIRAGEGPQREITAEDLIRLRDIGFPDAAVTGSSPLAVSPDGTQVAFVLSRADLKTNSHCHGLVVVPVHTNSPPRLIDHGGEFIPLSTFVRGLSVEVGLPNVVTPAWSPDGRFIAYLKRENGVTQVLVARVDGNSGRSVTESEVDVESVAWSSDGKSLIFASRPGIKATELALDREGRSGWLYDERIATNAGPRPRVRASDAPLQTFVLDLRSGSIRGATKAEASSAADNAGIAVAHSGRRAWTEKEDTSLVGPRRIWATDSSGKPRRCAVDACLGRPGGMWWDPTASELRFLRREGWNRENYAFYRWKPGTSAPVRSHATTDSIQNCVPAAAELICTVENAVMPRRVVALDPLTGSRRLIFDPNPEFAGIRLGSVRRLRWRNDRGLEAWGDLVLPPNLKKDEKAPMVVVQYHSRGFLRGGTGDEYPILLLAAQGFAVLSFERPAGVAATIPNLKTEVEANAANEAGWAERRSVQSALAAGIDAATATGQIDPRRVGITGLSDGATAVRFALINSDRFAAAAISSCCLEPKTVMTYGGIAWAEYNRAVGYPPATADDPEFWRPMSLALNAGRMRTPLLMQLADEEYLLALEAFEALREHGAPVDLYVFPDEHHVKWQPVHRLAIYNRNLEWFDFWLRCREDPAPGKAAQYRRWSAMRARAPGAAGLCARSRKLSSSTGPKPLHRPAA